MISQVDQHLHPSAPRDGPHQALEDCLVELCQDYRNPARPRFDTRVLVNAYNACLANQTDAFPIGQQQCAQEFLSCPGLRGNGLLNNLMLQDGFLTTFVESGVCWGCRQPQELVSLMRFTSFLLSETCRLTTNLSCTSPCLETTILWTWYLSFSLLLLLLFIAHLSANSPLPFAEQECCQALSEQFMERS